MKKFVLALLAVVLVLGLGTVAFAADHDPNGACEGFVEVYNEDSATCTDAGLQTWACSKCGTVLRNKTIPALKHSWENGNGNGTILDAKENTCTTDGYITLACKNVVNGKVCGATKTYTVEATGHDWEKVDDLSKPATCTEDGFDYFICKNKPCDATKTVTTKAIGHDWKYNYTIKEATCTAKGSEAQYCDNCGETRNVETAAVGHKFSEWQVVNEATCTEDGLKTRYCTNKWCFNGFTNLSATEEKEVIPARGHKWTEGEVIKAATCTEKGSMLYVCDCRATKFDEIAATGHTPNAWVENTELGVKTTTCKTCGAALVEALNPVAPVDPDQPADPDDKKDDEKKDDENSGNGSGNTTGDGSDASIPATGDNTSNAPYIMMVAAVAGLVALVASKRKVNC